MTFLRDGEHIGRRTAYGHRWILRGTRPQSRPRLLGLRVVSPLAPAKGRELRMPDEMAFRHALGRGLRRRATQV